MKYLLICLVLFASSCKISQSLLFGAYLNDSTLLTTLESNKDIYSHLLTYSQVNNIDVSSDLKTIKNLHNLVVISVSEDLINKRESTSLKYQFRLQDIEKKIKNLENKLNIIVAQEFISKSDATMIFIEKIAKEVTRRAVSKYFQKVYIII